MTSALARIHCTEAVSAPVFTPLAAIPTKFLLALALSSATSDTVPGPGGKQVTVTAGPAITTASEIEQAWFTLRHPDLAPLFGYTLPARVAVVAPVDVEVVA